MLKRPTHYRTTTRDTLSERQREVLALIAKGKTNAQIADELGLSLDGAKFHVREILGKLNVESREEAAALWRADQSAGTKVASFLRAATSLSWLKSAAAVAAVGGIALGSTALTIALTQGGGDKSEHADDGSAFASPSVAPTLDPASLPLDCEPAEIEWRGETRRNEDGSVRLDIYVRQANLPPGETCMIRGDALLTPARITPAVPGVVSVLAFPVTIPFEDEVTGEFKPQFVTSLGNVCEENSGVRIFLEWMQMGTGSSFDLAAPTCVNDTTKPEFHALWWALLSSTIPRLTPVPAQALPTPITFPYTPGVRMDGAAAMAAAAGGLAPGYPSLIPAGVTVTAFETTLHRMNVVLEKAGTTARVTVSTAFSPDLKENTALVATSADGWEIRRSGDSPNEALYLFMPAGHVWMANQQVIRLLGYEETIAFLQGIKP